MTLLVSLHGKDGIVAAADSRGTFGDPRGITAQNDSQQKAHLVSAHVAILLAGAAELGNKLLAEIVDKVKKENRDGVTTVMEVARGIARARYDEWLGHLPPAISPGTAGVARPDVQFIVTGYDKAADGKYGIARHYSLNSSLDFPPALHQTGFALAGVAQYALYLLNRLYEPNRSLSDLSALAVYALTETASQDGKVGGPSRVVNITPTDTSKMLTDDELKTIRAANDARSSALRRSFYTTPNATSAP